MDDPVVDNRLVLNALKAMKRIPKTEDKLEHFIDTLVSINLLPNIDSFMRNAFNDVFAETPLVIGQHLQTFFSVKDTKSGIDSNCMQRALEVYSQCLVLRLKKSLLPNKEDEKILIVQNSLVDDQSKVKSWLDMFSWLYSVIGKNGYDAAVEMAVIAGHSIHSSLVIFWISEQFHLEVEKPMTDAHREFCKHASDGLVEQFGGSWKLICQLQSR